MAIPVSRVILYVKEVAKVAALYQRHFGMTPLPGDDEDWVGLSSGKHGCNIALHKGGAAVKIVFGVADVKSFKAERDAHGLPIPFSGGCACGSIRYVCSREPIAMLNCHCQDCQRSSGAPFASGVIVNLADTAIIGMPKTYSVRASSGSLSTRSFCSECGSPLFTCGELAPAVMDKAGSAASATGFERLMAFHRNN